MRTNTDIDDAGADLAGIGWEGDLEEMRKDWTD